MTKTKETAKSTRPAPVELHDEALDRVGGGTTRTPSGGINVLLADGSVRFVK